VNALTINSDGTSNWQPIDSPQREWQNLTSEVIEERLYRAGVTVLGSSGIPTRYRSSAIEPGDVEHVIVHAVEDDIYCPSPLLLLQEERLQPFVEGLGILKRIVRQAEFHVVLNKERKDLLARLSRRTETLDWVHIEGLVPKYPQSRDEMLVSTLLGREIPYGYSSANIGVLVLDVEAVFHVYEAVADGKPLIEKTITLSGTGFVDPTHRRVRIGTPIGDVLGDQTSIGNNVRIVYNSLLSGYGISDFTLPVQWDCQNIVSIQERRDGEQLGFMSPGFKKDSYTKTFFSSVFPLFKKDINTNIHGEGRGCLSCGFCEEICPVGILPNLIHRFVLRDFVDEHLMRMKIFKCIDCNLCTYVCPSKIPVASLMRQGKDRLIEEGLNPTELLLRKYQFKGLSEERDERGA
jgi:Na(+)-translocating NADH:ubiquinone oxidoreductase A subunit